jgi:hypothetical protein
MVWRKLWAGIIRIAAIPDAARAKSPGLRQDRADRGGLFMPARILALFNLRPDITVDEYENWARTVDLPTVNALPSIDRFEVFRVTGRLGSGEAAPYAYAEIIDVGDMAAFGEDVATDRMKAVAAEFNRLADVLFLATEKLD